MTAAHVDATELEFHSSSRRRTAVLALAATIACVLPGLTASQSASNDVAQPTPRLPDGTVNLGPAPGEKGHWDTGRGGALMENEVELNGFFLTDPADVDQVAPFKPWSRGLFLARQKNLGKDDPHPRCSGPAMSQRDRSRQRSRPPQAIYRKI